MKTVKEDSEAQHFVTGVQLDKFGELYSLRRIDESDAEYRLRVIEKLKEINNDRKENHD